MVTVILDLDTTPRSLIVSTIHHIIQIIIRITLNLLHGGLVRWDLTGRLVLWFSFTWLGDQMTNLSKFITGNTMRFEVYLSSMCLCCCHANLITISYVILDAHVCIHIIVIILTRLEITDLTLITCLLLSDETLRLRCLGF